MALFKIDCEGDDCTDERTKLEDGPEDTESLALILLKWITHHDTALGRPEQSSGDAEDRTGKNQEPPCTLGLMPDGGEELVGRGDFLCWSTTHAQRAPT